MSAEPGEEEVNMTPLWLADLLFEAANRSVKFAAEGGALQLARPADWPGLRARLWDSAGPLVLFGAALAANLFLLLASMCKQRRSFFEK